MCGERCWPLPVCISQPAPIAWIFHNVYLRVKFLQPARISLYVPLKCEHAVPLAFKISQKATSLRRTPRSRLNRLCWPAFDKKVSVPDLPFDLQKRRRIASFILSGRSQIAVQLIERKRTINLQPDMVIMFSNRKRSTSPNAGGQRNRELRRRCAVKRLG